MNRGYRIFDTHTHLGRSGRGGRTCTADELLRNMDRFGIERSLVIPFPVVDDWQAEHDVVGTAVREHADRLCGAVSMYPSPEAVFREEVRRCREEYGFRALKLQPQYHGLNPFCRQSDFFFKTALENGMAVVWHTGAGVPFSLPSLLMAPARRFPDLRIVIAHCGGGLFMHEAMLAAILCQNVFLELSSLLPHQVLEILSEIPSERLMIGSDLPENLEFEIGKILSLDASEEDKRNILFRTACRVFGDSACATA